VPGASSALSQLVTTANQFISAALAGSTRATYSAGVNSYLSFCEHYHIAASLPIADDHLCLWASHLATRTVELHKKNAVTFKTIKSYASGLASLHTEMGYDGWLDSHRLFRRCMKGIKRSLGESSKRLRLPITSSLLDRMMATLAPSINYSHALFCAAATAGTYGLLRMGEFCSTPSANAGASVADHKLLTLSQLTLYDSVNQKVPTEAAHLYPTVCYYTLGLKTSKTDPFRKGVTVCVAHAVAVRAMLQYLQQHVAISTASAPLFVESRAPEQDSRLVALSRDSMIGMTRSCIQSLGLDSKDYHGHSYRRGGATSLAEKGVSDAMIQMQGRWSSNCYKLYVDLPLHQLLAASRSM
jgi:hypothetical protein